MKENKGNKEKFTFFMILAASSPIIGIVYLIIKGLLGLEEIWVIKENTTIENTIWKYSAIIWVIIFISQYFITKKISIKIFFNNLMALTACFFIYTGIIINIVYIYNNQDKNIARTEKLTILDRDSKVTNNGKSSRTVYYIITDSENKAFKRIGSSKPEFSSLSVGGEVYVKYYKGKLGSAFTTLYIPPNLVDEDLVDWENKGLKKIVSHKYFPLFITIFLFQTFSFWLLFLFWIGIYFTKISHKLLFFLIIFPILVNFLVYLMDNWIAPLIILSFMWVSMVAMLFLAYKIYEIISSKVDEFRNKIGNISYYALMTLFSAVYLYFCSFVLLEYLMKNFQV